MQTLDRFCYFGINKKGLKGDGFAINETIYPHAVSEDWHFHENAHFCFILKGGNREQRQLSDLDNTPGSLRFYHSGEIHRNRHTVHGSKNMNLEIEPGWYTRNNVHIKSQPRQISTATSKLLFANMYRELLQADQFTLSSVEMLMLEHFENCRMLAVHRPSWVNKIEERLNDDWSGTPALAELASITGVTAGTISRYFPKYFSSTLGRYMRKLKIERAMAMVADEELPLTEIAFECGFADQSHFTRSFKEETGLLPKQYRQMIVE